MIGGVFDETLTKAIANSRVLLIGAGGIGCEVLKNLVLSGFPKIEVIDLDTIDVSNLNRQFLFRKEHVGKSKAQVARDSALQFNPNVEIIARHDTIFNKEYGLSYFKQFNFVLNALDNRKARNHVNRICLAAEIPLIDTGTSGYVGQVELIKKGIVQCYECVPTRGEKDFPSCTIRNTPSKPIHCIVWGKHLFNQLFGHEDGDENVSPDAADPETLHTVDKEEMQKELLTRKSTRQWAVENKYDPQLLFTKLFFEDINYLLSMKDLWQSRNPPHPLSWNKVMEGESKPDNYTGLADHKVWSIQECAKVFEETVNALKEKLSSQPDGELVWDKDDKNAMKFVAASANIRAHIFNILPLHSCFEIKAMAGNIIPAIATANAIVAGLAVLRAKIVLRGELHKCTSVFMRSRPNHNGQLLVAEKSLTLPNPKCHVCSINPSVVIACNVNKLILKHLETALQENLDIQAADVYLDGLGVIVLSSEPGETDQNMTKTLSEIGVCDGTCLVVEDFLQNYEVRIRVMHDVEETGCKIITQFKDTTEGENDKEMKVDKKIEPTPGSSSHLSDDSDCEILEDDVGVSFDDDSAKPPKRRRVQNDV